MYKILSIDGGGIKGIAPASLLANIEERTGKKIIDYFDLIVGTSTGGIIALGLGLGFSAREILSLYLDNGDKIFKKQFFLKSLFGVRAPIYDTSALQRLLEEKFKGKLLGQSKVRLVIPSFDIVNNTVCMFKTSHHSRLQMDYTMKAEDVALSTAAAPYYFPPYKTIEDRFLVDGGMFANNPTLVGVVEGLSLLEWQKENIRVLSLGCSEETPEYSKLAGKKSGLLHWRLGLMDLAFNSQSSYSLGAAKLLLDDRDNSKILRISSVLSKGDVALDDISQSKKLAGIGQENARQNLEKIQNVFLAEKAAPFMPCHAL
jgi:Patatin